MGLGLATADTHRGLTAELGRVTRAQGAELGPLVRGRGRGRGGVGFRFGLGLGLGLGYRYGLG